MSASSRLVWRKNCSPLVILPIFKQALDADNAVWEDFTADIVAKITAFVYPKRLCACKEGQIIFNADSGPVRMEAAE